MSAKTDFIIVGGGIVGLATAYSICQRFPGASIRLVEKENRLARHQTGNNSGVVHAGVYYEPGSLKADFCRKGGAAISAFCHENSIAFDRRGKLIVATNERELDRLKNLEANCRANGLHPQWLSKSQLEDSEENITGLAAIKIGESAITDFPSIALCLARLLKRDGAEILLGAEVLEINEEPAGVTVETTLGQYSCKHLIACGGLMADKLAHKSGLHLDFKIVPFRGEYFHLPQSQSSIVHHLIYPVPDPKLPFLGIHLTPTIHGGVAVGPNAVLALAREGYSWRELSLPDMLEMISFAGFRKMVASHWRSGLTEFSNSLIKSHYLKQCQKYCPSLQLEDLRARSSGVRAQAILEDGTMVHDFLIRRTARTMHVCNAPSPAATSSFAIGDHDLPPGKWSVLRVRISAIYGLKGADEWYGRDTRQNRLSGCCERRRFGCRRERRSVRSVGRWESRSRAIIAGVVNMAG